MIARLLQTPCRAFIDFDICMIGLDKAINETPDHTYSSNQITNKTTAICRLPKLQSTHHNYQR